jgi:hypothetical protein
VWREAGGDGRLAMVVLRKRALSGPASLARSLSRRLEGLGAGEHADGTPGQLSLVFDDSVGGELTDEDREPDRELAAPGLADGRTERSLLLDLLETARRASQHDSKADRLVTALRAAREPAIVFTEYRDTLEDLRERLEGRVTLRLLHGAMLPGERQRSITAFESGAARVLLATDAAAEGLNLQRSCRWVFHYEVPWSPVRIEQRNGRVDRIGQPRRVHVWHFVAADTEEERVLARVAAKSSLAARDLGDQLRVAAAVFGETPDGPTTNTRTPCPPAAAAVAEAARVLALRRLPGRLQQESRPVISRMARDRLTLLVYRASVLDLNARSVASFCIGLRGRGTRSGGSHATAKRTLGRRARRSLAIHSRFCQAIRDREASMADALTKASGPQFQPSLFDRRAFVGAEQRRAEIDRALSELKPRSGRRRACTVSISMVGALAL